jgi:hypothetical protein
MSDNAVYLSTNPATLTLTFTDTDSTANIFHLRVSKYYDFRTVEYEDFTLTADGDGLVTCVVDFVGATGKYYWQWKAGYDMPCVGTTWEQWREVQSFQGSLAGT